MKTASLGSSATLGFPLDSQTRAGSVQGVDFAHDRQYLKVYSSSDGSTPQASSSSSHQRPGHSSKQSPYTGVSSMNIQMSHPFFAQPSQNQSAYSHGMNSPKTSSQQSEQSSVASLVALQDLLPRNWHVYTNADGIPYYYNEETGQTSWKAPAKP